MVRGLLKGLLAIGFFSMATHPGQAAVNTWTGGGPNNNWTTTNNWSLLRVPLSSDDVVFDASTNKASTLNSNLTVASVTVTLDYTNAITQNADFTVIGNFILSNGFWQFTAGTAANLTVTNNMYLTNATIYCQRASTGGNGTGRTFRVLGNLTVATNASINAVGLGFPAGQGPGRQLTGSGGGGGHGGEAGVWNHYQAGGPGGGCYGSVTNPTSLGSGGHYAAGGGAVLINVSGTTTIDGAILANGGPFTGDRGGGAGGSIRIITDTLQGNGSIYAKGSGPFPAYASGMASGGGGRIAIYCSTFSFPLSTNNLSASSVPCYYSYASAGAAGTLYIKMASEPLGTLIVDNHNVSTFGGTYPKPTTHISTSVTDVPDGNIVIRSLADVRVFSNATLTVKGYWTNTASFTADTNSTVYLGGTNDCTMSGNFGFFNLTCTNGGKHIQFSEKTTNTVQGVLTLKGELGNLLWLGSVGTNVSYLRVVDAAKSHQVRYVDVRRSYANASSIDAYESVNSGTNVNWVFSESDQTNIWTGGSSTDWANGANWSLGRSSVQKDFIVISNQAAFYPILTYAKVVQGLIILPGASLRLGGYNLTVTGNTSVKGTLTAYGSEILTLNGNLDLTGGTFNASNSTVILNGTGAQAITSDGKRFCTLSIANSAAPVTFNDAAIATNIGLSQSSVTFNGALTAGAVTNTGGALTFVGPVTVQSFANNGGSLAFSNAASFGSLAHTGANVAFGSDVSAFDFKVWGQVMLTFNPGSLFTTTNLWLSGTTSTSIVLRSSSAGQAWRLKVTRASGVSFADVKDSNASEGLTIRPIRCANSGGNLNWDFSQTADWVVWVGSVSAIFTNVGNWQPTGALTSNSMIFISGYYTNAPRLTSSLAVSNLVIGGHQPVTFTVDAPLSVFEDLSVVPNGILTHSANAGTPVYSLNVTVGRNLNVAGAVDVIGKGYAINQGPGKGGGSQGGGGHGGEGGFWSSETLTTCGPCYGSVTSPVTLGSGGWQGPGGGAMRLVVAGGTFVDGIITASGTDIGNSSAGAGGSIWLTTGTLEGSGTICADGGKGGTYLGYGYSHGGGGRLAVYLKTGSTIGSVKLRAASPQGAAFNHTGGGAGTVYVRKSGESDGTCFIDNNGALNNMRTVITSNVTDAVVGDLVLRSPIRLTIASNQTLTVNGSWSNLIDWASFTAETNSTVLFGGTNSALVLNTNRFWNLSCGNASGNKNIRFQAGSTNYVEAGLMLRNCGLSSTVDGAYWYLRLANAATQTVKRVIVRDSNASGGQLITAQPVSSDLGHNVNWLFLRSPGSLILIR